VDNGKRIRSILGNADVTAVIVFLASDKACRAAGEVIKPRYHALKTQGQGNAAICGGKVTSAMIIRSALWQVRVHEKLDSIEKGTP